jgi:hypothetical protein
MDSKVGSPTAVLAFMSVVSDQVQSRMGLRHHAENFLIIIFKLKTLQVAVCEYSYITHFVTVSSSKNTADDLFRYILQRLHKHLYCRSFVLFFRYTNGYNVKLSPLEKYDLPQSICMKITRV